MQFRFASAWSAFLTLTQLSSLSLTPSASAAASGSANLLRKSHAYYEGGEITKVETMTVHRADAANGIPVVDEESQITWGMFPFFQGENSLVVGEAFKLLNGKNMMIQAIMAYMKNGYWDAGFKMVTPAAVVSHRPHRRPQLHWHPPTLPSAIVARGRYGQSVQSHSAFVSEQRFGHAEYGLAKRVLLAVRTKQCRVRARFELTRSSARNATLLPPGGSIDDAW